MHHWIMGRLMTSMWLLLVKLQMWVGWFVVDKNIEIFKVGNYLWWKHFLVKLLLCDSYMWPTTETKKLTVKIHSYFIAMQLHYWYIDYSLYWLLWYITDITDILITLYYTTTKHMPNKHVTNLEKNRKCHHIVGHIA